MVSSCSGPVPAVGEPPQNLYRFQLKSGLKVNLLQDLTAPEVAIKLAFTTSYRDENPGTEGVRLVATGQVLSREDLMEKVEALGGWWDPTNYYPEVSSKDIVLHARCLDQGVEVVAAMLGSLHGSQDAWAEKTFEITRQEELEELKGAAAPGVVPSKPSKIDIEAFEEPWGRQDPRGLMPDMNKLTAKDVIDFRHRVMKPSRCMLTIAGAFDALELQKKLEEKLGSIVDDTPPEAPRILDGFLSGKHVQDKGDKDQLVVALAVPDMVDTPMAGLLVHLIKKELVASVPPGVNVVAELRMRPGQRVLVFAMDSDPSTLLNSVPQALQSLASSIKDEDLDALRVSWFDNMLQNRLGNLYWQTWACGFTPETLFHPDRPPWEVRRMIALYKADDAVRALKTFDPSDSVVVEYRQNAHGRKVLREGKTRPHTHVTWKPSKLLPVTLSAAQKADALSFTHPRLTSSPSGNVLTLEAPQFGGGALRGTYTWRPPSPSIAHMVEFVDPLIRSSLEQTKPDCVDTLRFGDDRIEFMAMWSQETQGVEAVRAVASWLESEAGWRFSYAGDAEGCQLARELLDSPLPSVVPGTEVMTRLQAVSSDGSGNVLVRMPIQSDPRQRALTLMLLNWLDPDSRTVARYGPFTLTLPPLPEHLTQAQLLTFGDTCWISLRSKDPLAARTWLKKGAALGTVDSKVFAKIRGHARGHFSGSFTGLRTPQAEIVRQQSGGGPQWMDQSLDAIDNLTPEDFVLFSKTCLDAVK